MRKLAFFAILLFAGSCLAQPVFDIVQTDAGKISGSKSRDGAIHVFKGIPFAAPPVGELRWKPPQPVQPWQDIKACANFAASPMQMKPTSFGVYTEEFLIRPEPISEDCLYLNVWTGAKSKGQGLPVLVWIYEGGFVTGGTNVPIYDGEAIAKKGVIFVSIPYRLGIFGFLAHPELSNESPEHASGNYGLMDLIAALQWIKRNIAAFGGDPDRVTIAGQSAGSMDINFLVASPLAKSLFRRAIAESGANFLPGGFGAVSLDSAEKTGMAATKSLHVSTLAELRKLSAEELLKQSFMRPIIDGYVLPATVATTFESGKDNSIDLMTGWNKDDGFAGAPKTASNYKLQIENHYGNEAPAFLRLYPAGTDSAAAVSQMRIARDEMFGAQNYQWANYQASNHRKIYLYRFTRAMPATAAFKKYGAFHTAEVAYALNNLPCVNRPFEQADRRLADLMSSYWANFAKTGDPNESGLPKWPLYQPDHKDVMFLDIQPTAGPLADKDALDFMVKQAGTALKKQ